jgi:hypothetical protein
MKKSLLQDLVKKIGVIEPANEPLTYKLVVESNEITIPFINSSESIKGYVKTNNFELEDCEVCVSDAKLFNKTLSKLNEDIKLSIDDDKLIVKDDKYTLEYYLMDEATILHVNSLEECFLFDDDQWDATIIFDKNFIDDFLSMASNEKYEFQDTFTLKYNPKKDNFIINLGKKVKVKFKVEGTKLNENNVDSILRVQDFVNIFSANKDCQESYLHLSHEVIRLEFTNSNDVKAIYNICPENDEH